MRGKLIFVTGGIRSGKSAFAERLVSELGHKVTYIATAQVFDEEMKNRVELHRQRRPDSWQTVEEQLRVSEVIAEHGETCEVIMLDCLNILLSNMMFADNEVVGRGSHIEIERGILEKISVLAEKARGVKAHVVVVSNEVGNSLVSDNLLGRQFQDLAGRANQLFATAADEAYLIVAGYPVVLKKERGEI